MEETFLNSLYFKSILITYEKDELIEMLEKSDDPLKTFLTLLGDTAEADPSFFALDDSFLDKINYVIHKYRFDGTEKDEETIGMINDIILHSTRKLMYFLFCFCFLFPCFTFRLQIT